MDYTHLIFHDDIVKKSGNINEPSFGGSGQQNIDKNNGDGSNSF